MSVVVKSAQQNGDIVVWTINVTNPSINTCLNNKVVFTIPTGVSITGPTDPGFTEINVPQGSFDGTTKTWWIGDLPPSSDLSVDFEFTVDDISQADTLTGYFEISADLTSSCVETSTANNMSELVIKIGPACDDDNLSIGSGEEADTGISIG